MAAYAALVSLMQVLDNIRLHPRPLISLNKKQFALLTERVTFLLEFLRDTETDLLRSRIVDAAYAAEDAIESYIADQIMSEAQKMSSDALYEALEKVIEEMALIQKEAMEIKEMRVESQLHTKSTRLDFTEISPPSIREFLLKIGYAARTKKTKYYDEMLRMILEDNFLAPTQLWRSGDNFPSEIFLGRDDDKKSLLSLLMSEDEKVERSAHAKEVARNTGVGFYRGLAKGSRGFSSFKTEEATGKETIFTGGRKKFGTQISAIQIAGCSGIGKTSLARVVYEERSVKEHFDLLVWAQFEGRELDLKHAAQGILRSAMGMSCAVDELDELDEMVRDTLQAQRCLIVFDGIGTVSNDSWLHMSQCWFDILDLGSKLVLITNPTTSIDVPNLVTHELPPLSPHNVFSLFSCIAFEFDTLDIASSMAVEKLASGCEGIPLVLKLFGSLIRCDQKKRDFLLETNLLPPLWDASATILLCVVALPPSLRRCLAYCALFPKGSALNKEKMVDMWIADGHLKPSAVDIGDGDACFRQLLCRSFFTDITRDQYDNVIEFRIPSLIHEILEDVARIVYNEKLGLIGSMSEDAGQLSLASPLAENFKSKHLRTMILSPTLYFGGSLDHSLIDFHELCSLDLSCSGIRSLSGDICMLRELKYLNLSYTHIESLPDSITDLSLLHTLDLSWCYHLKFLPSGLRDLTLMSHLDLSRCETLSYIPSGIGSLTSLSSMPLFVLGKDRDSAGLRELGPLNQLKGRLEIRNLENVMEVIEARDAKLDRKRLQHLELSWSQSDDDDDDDDDDDCFQVLELLQPNQQLEVLGLRGYRGSEFPQWISYINNLVKISITDCECEELPSLGQLSLLKELQLKGMTNLEFIGREFYGKGIADVSFPSLERLEVCDLPSLWGWLGDERAFLSLKFVTIEDCPQLSDLPLFPTLHDLILSNNDDSILDSVAKYESLCSLLMNGVGFRDFTDLYTLGALKKLILHNSQCRYIDLFPRGWDKEFSALEHLGILHCNELKRLTIREFSALKKLHIVDCRDLQFMVLETDLPLLMELVVENCPQALAIISLHKLHSLRKLVVRNCDKFTIHWDVRPKKLQYLSITGCPSIERELQEHRVLISHVPCVIVGNHKANYEGMIDSSKGINHFLVPELTTSIFYPEVIKEEKGGIFDAVIEEAKVQEVED